LEMQINPAAEWKQMYKEVLRIERDFFYDPGHHGLDVQALGERYEKYLAGMGSRGDLKRPPALLQPPHPRRTVRPRSCGVPVPRPLRAAA
jgi:hypothetical protein